MAGDDDSYETSSGEDEEEQITSTNTETKSKKKTIKNKAKGKYKFSKSDIIEIAEMVKIYGRQYALIQKELFTGSDPPVTRKDVQNLINGTPSLAGLSKESHNQIKAPAKRKFDSAFLDKKKEDQSSDTKSETISHDFTHERLWFFASERYYGWLLRADLGDDVDVQANDETYVQTWTIEKKPLMPKELEKTQLCEFAKADSRTIEETYEYKPGGLITKFSHKIPKDALLNNENGPCVQRKDHDVDAGALIEIFIPRVKKSNQLHLKAKRFTHFDTQIKTTNPLAVRSETNNNEMD